MNLDDLTKEQRTYVFGLQRLEDAFRDIDYDPSNSEMKHVDCNKYGFEQIKNYILTGIHVIWPFKIIKIEDELIRISYKNVPILIWFNIKGAY